MPGLSSEDANAAIAYFGNDRKAAAFLNMPRSTLYHIARGESPGSARTAARFKAGLPGGVARVVEATAGLIRNRGGPNATTQRAEAQRLIRQERQAPGSIRTVSTDWEVRMARQGLDVYGNLVSVDSRGRAVVLPQQQAYAALLDDWNHGRLKGPFMSERYKRFIEYTLGEIGEEDPDIEPL